MRRSKKYPGLAVNSECMRQLSTAFGVVFNKLEPAFDHRKPDIEHSGLCVERANEEWSFDIFEEFSLDLDIPYKHAQVTLKTEMTKIHVNMSLNSYATGGPDTDIWLWADNRETLVLLAGLVDQVMKKYGVHIKPSFEPVVFIGHGRSIMWRDLKDHLVDQHGFRVESFESGINAGAQISEVLDHMMRNASIAFLVMAAEDEMADGTRRARQNVIHEIGLFQGRLGMARAIVLKEDGTDDFSNIQGIQQIRFSSANIRETFGEVVATIKRETGQSSSEIR